MPRFVVQHHTLPDGDDHWDLMLEAGEALWTWSLPHPPEEAARGAMAARHLGDHRLAYLDYEGEVSDGRGRVEIHDRGTYEWLGAGEELTTHLVDRLEFVLSGEKVGGRFRLKRESREAKDLWRLGRF
jgi:DNA ligase D-like protein (predicted 3'-phosphoesterase)